MTRLFCIFCHSDRKSTNTPCSGAFFGLALLTSFLRQVFVHVSLCYLPPATISHEYHHWSPRPLSWGTQGNSKGQYNSLCAFKNARLTCKEWICQTVLSRVTIFLFSLRKQAALAGREFSEDCEYPESIRREKPHNKKETGFLMQRTIPHNRDLKYQD